MHKVMIGLETHIQLNTKSKLFCGCATIGNPMPNTQTCNICLGHPGAKPMINKIAFLKALKLCVALGCTIAPKMVFSRKTYFYPDMAKNFQITQYEVPLGSQGTVKLKDGRRITIQRIHMEEDPAALVHDGSIATSSHVLIDYNRSGIPLCEIVTTPCMTTPAQAREYLKELLRIVEYLSVYGQDCVMKTDANISVGTHKRVEVKNIGGFKDVEKALNYEIVRQSMVLKQGKSSVQETRAWDNGKTISLRSKETEADYGYIVDADLVPTLITEEHMSRVKSELPELAHVREKRFVDQFGLDPVDAEVMCLSKTLAELFERLAQDFDPADVARWLRRELLRVLNYAAINIDNSPISEEQLKELLQLRAEKAISERVAQKLMEKMMTKALSPREYVREQNLGTVSDVSKISAIVQQVIDTHPDAVADYKNGTEKSFHFLFGQVMRETRGQADPGLIRRVLQEKLN